MLRRLSLMPETIPSVCVLQSNYGSCVRRKRTGHMPLLSMLRLLLLSMQPSTGDVAMGSLTI